MSINYAICEALSRVYTRPKLLYHMFAAVTGCTLMMQVQQLC